MKIRSVSARRGIALTCRAWFRATALAATLALAPMTFSVASAEPYRAMSGDTLRIDVFLSPEHSADTKVDDAGQITLPAIGRVRVSGLTAEEIENAIREKLKSLADISGVRVVVSVIEYRPISVLGLVNNPGRYPYSARTTVLQALALAGGIGNPLIRRNDPAQLVDRQENYQVQTLQYWSALARHARLLAEQSGADAIDFPANLVDQLNSAGKQGVLDGEKEIFNVRKHTLAESFEIINARKKIVQQEIENSKNYSVDVSRSVPEMQKELDDMTSLRDKGLTRRIDVMAVQRYVSDMQQQRRQSDLTVTRSGRELNDLDNQAAILTSQRQAEIVQALVDSETEIAILKTRLDNQSKLLVGGSALTAAASAGSESEMATTYEIVRLNTDGAATNMTADENTLLFPGDVLEVVERAKTADKAAISN
jgi:protein involved in polysaccharide export with SLBB domain